jgi:type II secretion system protein C
MRENRKPLLQRAPIFMMPLLVMALSASLAKLLWMVVSPVQDVSASPIMTAVAPIQVQQNTNFGRIIADNHLFGEVPRVAPVRPPAPVAQQAPPPPAKPAEPPLKLSLHGLWAKKRSEGRTEDSFKAIPIEAIQASLDNTLDLVSKLNSELDSLFVLNVAKSAKNIPPKKSRGSAFAIISQAGGEQKMYSEGENIADAVKIVEIYADKVVVENRGVIQEIFLSDGENTTVTASAPRNIPRSSSVAGGQGSPRPNTESAPRKRNENLGQQDLRTLRTDIMNDVSILAQYSAPEPLLMDGEVKGFRLHLSNRLRLLYQIGFRPGDVITELNGVRLNDPDTIQQTLYNFIGAEQLSVSVMRGQQEETFRYSFE